MQKSGFPKMHHYVGFWQIGSHLNVARPVSGMSVYWQDSNIIVKSIDQSLNSCESMVQSRVQDL